VLFLASFVLRGQSQAALVAATLALLGLLFPPAAWISGAAIGLVTLVKGPQQGLLAVLLSAIGAAVFAMLVLDVAHITVLFVLLVWLPVWLVATILRQTVSLALSLQALTALGMFAVLLLYTAFPQVGELWREALDQVMLQLAEQSPDFDAADMQQTKDWLIAYLPGLMVSSVLFGTLVSLLLARWWQAVFYNPGGFASEFQALDLGKTSAMIAALITAAAMLLDSVMVVALMTVVLMLYLVQGLALMHALIRIRGVHGAWLVVLYLMIFFIPHLMLVLFILALFDPWLDFRNRSHTGSNSGPDTDSK